MLLTGARRGEILGCRWDELDLAAAVWHRPHYRLKQKRDHHLPLSPAAVAVLRAVSTDGEAKRAAAKKRGIILPESPFVFPGGGEPQHVREVTKFWRSIQRSAGLQGVRMHDLRHSFASLAASAGMSLPMVGALLGHASVATTQRYAHLWDSPLREGATAIADRIAEYAARPPTVVPLPSKS